MPKPRTKTGSVATENNPPGSDLVIITGTSGSGKLTALKAFEDLGFYAVDNLPIALIPKFADLARDSKSEKRSALSIDIREGAALKTFPRVYADIKKRLNATIVFLDADDETLQRRFSETRRPHPLGAATTVLSSIADERKQLTPIRGIADLYIDTTRLNVHELRRQINEKFRESKSEGTISVHINSFGFRYGVPSDSDLVFDVRFLPNPNYIPEFKHLTGRHPSVARYIRSFPQTTEFINRISELLIYLLPHYIREGKSYLTISFGCTGGRHRSVLIAHEIFKRLKKAGFDVKERHRDSSRE